MEKKIITTALIALFALLAGCNKEVNLPPDIQVHEDYDGDGVPDALDNCPLVANAAQADSDDDGIGDICDPDDADRDRDGYSTRQGDCDDKDVNVHPGAQEVCDDEDDNDCDGFVDCVDQDCFADKVCEHVITDAGTDADAAGDAVADADATEDVVADVPAEDAVAEADAVADDVPAEDVPVDDAGVVHTLAITYTPPSGGAVDVTIHGHFCDGVNAAGDAYGCDEWYQLAYVASGVVRAEENFDSSGVFEFNADFEALAPFHACAQPSGGGALTVFGTLSVLINGAAATYSVVTNHMNGCNLRVSIP